MPFWLGRSMAAAALGVLALVASLMSSNPARAQLYEWGGSGSTTSTTDYNLNTNWSTPGSAPPVTAGQLALFSTLGSATVIVTASPTLPASWTFDANSQSYSISGANVGFSPVVNSGILNFANTGQTITISNNLSEAVFGVGPLASVQQLGNSTLVLSGTNTYQGGTLISFGTVQVTNNSSVGSGDVTLNGGTFQANSLGSLTFSNNFAINTPGGTVDLNGSSVNLSGVIANGNGGTGVLNVIDSSGNGNTLELSGVNTYTGGTNANGVTLEVTNGSAVGTGTVTLTNAIFQTDGSADLTIANNFKLAGGSLLDANGVTLTIAGNITGGGQLEVANGGGPSGFAPGTVVMLGTNTYSGGTFICSCATLQLGDTTHTASLVGTVLNDGSFNIVNANTGGITSLTNEFSAVTTFSNSTSASTMHINNVTGGSTVFANTSTAGSATIVNNNGGVVFADQSTAGNATITNRNGGGVIFESQSTAGSATITNNNGGFVEVGVLPGDTATAGNATIINNSGGQTQFGDLSTAGNATIITNSGGGVDFFDNSTGGTAQFITNGTGFVDFSGSLGPNGDGRITAGSIAGSGFYYIGAGNTLVVGGNNLSTTVSGVIADTCGCGPGGPGSLEKTGSGTLTLSGANTYTGTTTVTGGVLDVEGSIATSSLVTVNANGALAGAGTVGNTTIASGGIFTPGNATPGSAMIVAGNLAFQSGALYLVQLNSTTSTSANVTGTATLAGTVGASIATGSTVMKQYTILTATGGVSGTFSGAAITGSNFLGTLSYDPTHAYLNLVANFGGTSGLNVNQRNVGNALSNFFNANGGIASAFASLSPNGLTQASAELATGSQQATFNAMNLFMGMLTDLSVTGRGDGTAAGSSATAFAEEGASAYAASPTNAARNAFASIPTKAVPLRSDPFAQRWSVWGASYGGGSTTDGNAVLGSNSVTAHAYGVVAGADYRILPSTVAGFALAGGGTNFSVSNSGTGRSDLFQAGAFVRHDMGAAYLSGALGYGWQDVTTNRTVTAAGAGQLRAEFNANAFSGRLEGGYRFATPTFLGGSLGVTPYAAAQFTTFDLPSYAEQVLSGSGALALSYGARDVTDSRSEIGVRTDRSFALQNAILILSGRLAWAHDFDPDRAISAVFQTLPGASFVVNGAAQAHESALTTASAEMKWANGWSAAATFEGEFSSVTQSYAGKGVLRYSW